MVSKRFSANVGAHLFGQVVTVFTIIFLPWLLLSSWSVDQYGEYIMGLAISQFFIYSDFGISGAVGNKYILDNLGRLAHGYQRYVLWRVFKIISAVLLVYFLIALLFRFSYSISLLVFSSALQPILNVFQNSFRINDKIYFGVLYSNFARLCEFAIVAAASIMGLGVVEAIFSGFLVKLVFVIFALIGLKKFDTSAVHISSADYNNFILGVFKPALSGVLNFLAINVLLQGLVLVISVLGVASVAVFNSARTLSRAAWQPISVLYGGLAPELTTLFGRGERYKLKKLVFLKTIGVFVFASIIAVCIHCFSDEIENVWLHGKIDIPTEILSVLLVSGVFHMTSQSIFQSLMAINKGFESSRNYLFVSILILLASYALVGSVGMYGVSLIWLFGELVFFFYAIFCFKKIIFDIV